MKRKKTEFEKKLLLAIRQLAKFHLVGEDVYQAVDSATDGVIMGEILDGFVTHICTIGDEDDPDNKYCSITVREPGYGGSSEEFICPCDCPDDTHAGPCSSQGCYCETLKEAFRARSRVDVNWIDPSNGSDPTQKCLYRVCAHTVLFIIGPYGTSETGNVPL